MIAPLCMLGFEEFGSFPKYKWPPTILFLIGMMRRYECEVPFDFFSCILFCLGVWLSSRVVFVLIHVLPHFHLTVVIQYLLV